MIVAGAFFIAVCVGIIVGELLWTYLHNRALERHTEEVRRIYAKHGGRG